MQPPDRIDGAEVLAWAWAGARPFGVVKDTDGRVRAEVYGFAIARYDDPNAIYRLSCDGRWETVQDGLYGSIEEAKAAIPEQYDRSRIAWQGSE